MTAGETIQSYNHQLVVTKSEHRQQLQLDNSNDDDNIDVVNDNERDLGEFFFVHISQYIVPALYKHCKFKNFNLKK
jgi:hypothetical protein